MQHRFLRINAVSRATGMSRSTIYNRMKTGEFPPSHQIGARLVVWLERDVEEWMNSKIDPLHHLSSEPVPSKGIDG